jgi:hypothetical protein
MVKVTNWPELLQNVKVKIQEATEITDEVADEEIVDEGLFGRFGLFPRTGLIANKRLNPIIFDKKEVMHPIIRDKILKIVDVFVKTIKLDELKLERMPGILDIIIAGSNANYNYASDSDLDVHVIFDVKSKTTVGAAIKQIFTRAKNQWNTRRNIYFKKIPVEVYIETPDTPKSTGGEYSVKYNRWNKPPIQYPATKYRDREVMKLATSWADMIDDAIKSKDKEKMKNALFHIRKERSRALDEPMKRGDHISGEVSIQNQAFKFLRRIGYIDKIDKAMDELTDKELSLESKQLDEQIRLLPGTIIYHKRLNRNIFDADRAEKAKLMPEVREKAMLNAKEFAQFVGLPWSRVLDVRFKGSLANYNYTPRSDFDLHLVSDVTALEMEIYTNKRIIWKEKYGFGIRIMGFPVEPMIERPDKIHSSSAIYSIMKDEWIDKPVYLKKPNLDRVKAHRLYIKWRKLVTDAFKEYRKNPSSKNLGKLRDVERKIRGERDLALPGSPDQDKRISMEFSPENSAFKRLRDTGVFDKIRDIYEEDKIRKLSLTKRKSFYQWMVSWFDRSKV